MDTKDFINEEELREYFLDWEADIVINEQKEQVYYEP
jgi:hypothetical protein